ncbi:AraC family transcriptional regulator [Pseudoteredinibacter isoporae]|uniref:AraC family transcriptional regulator n=1 Tax=Pseudoteredinibacter isoporae TaxID=570281 RepID=UPI0031048BA0
MLTIDIHFIRAPLRQAAELGIDTAELLNELDISADIFAQDSAVVHAEQYVRLVQKLRELSGDEYWGLTGQRCKLGYFALMARYLLQFDSLKGMLNECCRFQNTTRVEWQFSLVQEEGRVGFLLKRAQGYEKVSVFLMEFITVCIHRMMCWLTDTRIPILENHFAYPAPENQRAYELLFPERRVFNSDVNGFYIDAQYLSLPRVRDWTETRSFLQNAPAGLMVIPGSDNSYTAQIKAILLQTIGKEGPVPDFERVAEKLNVSTATLRRKLRSENTSYQQLKDTMRRDIAIDKLVRESTAISEIGLQLGFVESSSFTRAFKQWTGVSPQEYRRDSEV